jgi:hypothetical protein
LLLFGVGEGRYEIPIIPTIYDSLRQLVQISPLLAISLSNPIKHLGLSRLALRVVQNSMYSRWGWLGHPSVNARVPGMSIDSHLFLFASGVGLVKTGSKRMMTVTSGLILTLSQLKLNVVSCEILCLGHPKFRYSEPFPARITGRWGILLLLLPVRVYGASIVS